MKARTVIHTVIGAIGIVACVAMWVMTAGCDYNNSHQRQTASATSPDEPVVESKEETPAPVVVSTPWAYDAQWAAVTACWGYAPARPTVTVRPETHDFVDEWGRKVHGYFLAPSTVVVAADLAALEHELSEAACWSLTGAYCRNVRGGCFDVGVVK